MNLHDFLFRRVCPEPISDANGSGSIVVNQVSTSGNVPHYGKLLQRIRDRGTTGDLPRVNLMVDVKWVVRAGPRDLENALNVSTENPHLPLLVLDLWSAGSLIQPNEKACEVSHSRKFKFVIGSRRSSKGKVRAMLSSELLYTQLVIKFQDFETAASGLPAVVAVVLIAGLFVLFRRK
jgi:hypothetical protein